MRILSIVDKFPPVFGGVGEYTFFLLQELSSYGHEVAVVCENHEEIKSTDWCEVFPVVESWTSIRSMNRAAATIQKFEPDIILLQYDAFAYNRFGAPLSLIPLMLYLKKNGKVVVFFHEVRSKFKRFGILRFFNVLLQIITVNTVHFFSDLSITSLPFYADLIHRPFVKSKRVEIIRIGSNVYNGNKNIDTRTLRKKMNLEQDFVIATFGYKPRNILFILDCLPSLIEKSPDLKLLLIGRTEPNLLQEIYRKIENLNLKDAVIFTGALPADSVFSYLKLADIYLMLEPINEPGLWSGSSTRSGSLAAAFGAGLPVIGTKGEKTDHFFSRNNIFLIEKMDAESLKKAIFDLKSNLPLRKKISMGAKQSFKQELSWNVIAKKMVRSFERMLSSAPIEK